jgi:hypothetical protein
MNEIEGRKLRCWMDHHLKFKKLVCDILVVVAKLKLTYEKLQLLPLLIVNCY